MASKNINVGPTNQFWTNEILSTFTFLKTSGSFSYLTFAIGGYIIRIKPIAIRIFVVPI